LPPDENETSTVDFAAPAHDLSTGDGCVASLRDVSSEPAAEEYGGGCPMAGAENGATDTLYYWDYLHLDSLLNAQMPKSAAAGDPKHDEFFFIAMHQTCELWFKQILVELDSVNEIMSQEVVADRDMGTVLSRLQRINQIQRLLIAQIDVLETLSPLDFLDFRSFLVPASGFQSVQFRLIENKFGLLSKDRLKVEGQCYVETLRDDHADLVDESEQAPSLFDHVERWLARTPFLSTESFDFVARYRDVAKAIHTIERAEITGHTAQNPTSRDKQLRAFESSVRKFDAVFDEARWQQDVQEGRRRLSYDAFMAALFINLYRDEPVLQLPSRILTALIEIDESFTIWRQRHALMAHRMLGRQSGTAGSGHGYLEETAKRHKAYKDLFDVSTYLLPSSALPTLPDSLLGELGYRRG